MKEYVHVQETAISEKFGKLIVVGLTGLPNAVGWLFHTMFWTHPIFFGIVY